MSSAGRRDVVISASSGPVVSLVGSSALPDPPGDVAPLPVNALKDIRTVRTGRSFWISPNAISACVEREPLIDVRSFDNGASGLELSPTGLKDLWENAGVSCESQGSSQRRNQRPKGSRSRSGGSRAGAAGRQDLRQRGQEGRLLRSQEGKAGTGETDQSRLPERQAEGASATERKDPAGRFR